MLTRINKAQFQVACIVDRCLMHAFCIGFQIL